jgi:hypothetical protein
MQLIIKNLSNINTFSKIFVNFYIATETVKGTAAEVKSIIQREFELRHNLKTPESSDQLCKFRALSFAL